jgi:hypothetical protein
VVRIGAQAQLTRVPRTRTVSAPASFYEFCCPFAAFRQALGVHAVPDGQDQQPELPADIELAGVDGIPVGGEDARAVDEAAGDGRGQVPGNRSRAHVFEVVPDPSRAGRHQPAAGSGRTAAVLAATFATTGEGARRTITFAPSARTSGSVHLIPKPAAAETAARAAAAEVVKGVQTACRRMADPDQLWRAKKMWCMDTPGGVC